MMTYKPIALAVRMALIEMWRMAMVRREYAKWQANRAAVAAQEHGHFG